MAPIPPRSSQKRKINAMQKNVGVYVRLRPVSDPTVVKVDDQRLKAVPPNGAGPQIYKFTHIFDENAQQKEIFNSVAKPVVEDFITSAKDGLMFTYGITGSGKTYTMEGCPRNPGLIHRTLDFIFNSISFQQTPRNVVETDGQNNYRIVKQEKLYPNLRSETPKPSHIKWQNRTKESASVDPDPTARYTVFISLVELYNKQINDLFDESNPKKRLEIRSDHRNVSYVANVTEVEVKSADEAVKNYLQGIQRRRTGSTALNQESSRGHCVFNIKLVITRNMDEKSLVTSQLCLVDLAGSERAKRSGATGEKLQEAGNINNSLGALRECIKALREGKSNKTIRYREYSLTRLFKHYFEGLGSVCMILCVNPSAEDFNENNMAMNFGILTQEVPIDFVPAKMFKRDIDDLSDAEFFEYWTLDLKRRRQETLKIISTINSAQREVRETILRAMEEIRQFSNDKESVRGSTKDERESSESLTSSYSDTEQTPLSTPESVPLKSLLTSSPQKPCGVPVFNPRHKRSLSTSSIKYVNHAPQGSFPTGTVLRPKFQNGKPVKELQKGLFKGATGYTLLHHGSNTDGNFQTEVYTGTVIPTICGGVHVALDDVETMKQESPQRKRRAASDASYYPL